MDETVATAERFARAILAGDYQEALGALVPDARLRYLIPRGPAEVEGAAEVAGKILSWFADADAVEIERLLVEPIGGRTSVRYRCRIREGDRSEVAEQQLYVDGDGEGRIEAIDLLCSGFRPVEATEGTEARGTHRFDAGTLGCADGLAREFRREILAIPPGDVLVVATSDPAAKQDLPPLARLLGHTVRSVEPADDGRLLITVERGR